MNEVGTVGLSGREIIELIKQSETDASHSGRPNLYWSGLVYKKEGGGYFVEVGGKSIDAAKVYKVTTTDYLAQGGRGYFVFRAKKFDKTGKYYRDVVTEYFKKGD